MPSSFFYLNLYLSQIIAWMVRRLISVKVVFLRKQPVFSPSLPLFSHSRMVGHGRSMTRTSSLVRLCRTSSARASMNPSRAKWMVGDSRSCISRGMIIMRTITNNSYVAYHIWHRWWDECHRIRGSYYHSSKESPTSMKLTNTIHL